MESLTESPEDTSGDELLEEVLEELPLLMRLENDALLYALKELNERERSVFLARVLDGMTFEELADRMHLSYKGVAAIYYRALRKIRQKMTEVDHEF